MPAKKATKPNTPAEKQAPPADPVSTTGEGAAADAQSQDTQEGGAMEAAAAVAPQPLDAAEVVGDAEQLPYRVISPLRHNGKPYQVGDLVDLAGEQAARLIGLRVVELVTEEEAA